MIQSALPGFDFRTGARRASRVWQELIVDNFAGGGGASLGIELATGRAVDISVNHDPEAVEMHRVNHPASRHLCESVWQVNPLFVTNGRPVGLAWFSPDCRHFSRAKGGKPVEKNIRGLAWIVCRWAGVARPRVIILENVREFRTWGPLNRNRRPIKVKHGQTFRRWLEQLRAVGYAVEWRELDAADFGAPTHRKRLFIVARRDGQPIVWPEKTHGPHASYRRTAERVGGNRRANRADHVRPIRLREVSAGECEAGDWPRDPRRDGCDDALQRTPTARLKPYRTAAECIDWSIGCPSIFDRKRPLAEKTMRRIALGLKRYVLENPRPFIVQVNHGGDEFRGQECDRPFPTVSAKHGFGVVTPYLCEVQNGSSANGTRGVDRPMHTVTAHPKGGGMSLVAPVLVRHYGGDRGNCAGRATDVDGPFGTVTCSDHHALVAAWCVKHFGGVVGRPIDEPLPTTTERGTQNQVACAYLARFNHGEKQWAAVDEPLGTVTSQGNKFGLVYAFLLKYFGTAIGAPLNEPLHTLTSKDRFGVVTVSIDGQPYAIADIGMRMLTPRELARAQGFPDSYILTGTKSSQVAKIGNSVCPVMAEVLVRANFREREEVAA